MRILVVDDDTDIREILALALTSALPQHEVCTASNGEIGWVLYQQAPCHVVICDWLMPEMSGYNLSQKILESPGRKNTVFVMMTAYDTEKRRLRAISSGSNVYLRKPIDLEDIIGIINIAEATLKT